MLLGSTKAIAGCGKARLLRRQPVRTPCATRPTFVAQTGGDDEGIISTSKRLAAASILLAGLALGAAPAEAKPKITRDYYQELLETSKKPDTAALLRSYERVNTPEAAKASKAKLIARKASAGASKASAGGATFTPVEVGIGLLLVAGAAVIGNKPSTKGAAPAPKAAKPAATSGTLRFGAGTAKAIAPAARAGTQRGSGTSLPKKKAAPPPPPPPPKKVVAAKGKATAAAKPDGQAANATGIIGLGVAGAALGALLLTGNPSKAPSAAVKTPAASNPAPAKVVAAPEAPATAPALEAAPAPVAAPAPEPTPVPTPPPAATPASPTAAQAPAAATDSPGIPPLLIIGGVFAAAVGAAAVADGGGGQAGSGAEGRSPPPAGGTDAADAAGKRAAEARAWIAAWRAKQGQ